MFKRIRDAVTGRFTTAAEAKRRPNETVAERGMPQSRVPVGKHEPIRMPFDIYVHKDHMNPDVHVPVVNVLQLNLTDKEIGRLMNVACYADAIVICGAYFVKDKP